MQKRVWAILLAAALVPQYVRADQTSVGVQLAGTHGTHRESEGTVNAPLVPVPIVTVSHRAGCFEVAAEGLPPVGPIRIANNGLGMRDIALTYVDGSVRYWNRSGTLGIGVGETLYNQRTTFVRVQDATHFGTEVDQSRVAGTRYEIAGRVPIGTKNEFRATLGVNPAMHGRYAYDLRVVNGPFPIVAHSPANWERASQVDADARFVHRSGAYAFSYGVRYLNYTAAYTSWAAPRFADSNSLLMPYVGVERFFGASAAARADMSQAPCLTRSALAHIDAFAGAQIAAGHQQTVSRTARAARSAMALAGIRVRRGPYEGFAVTLPVLYAAAGARYWLPGERTAFGVGDALYTSRTRLGLREEVAVRAAGVRYEALQRIALSGRQSLTLDLAAAPRMHQRLTSWIDNLHGTFPASFATGSLVDASATFEVPSATRHMWLYGVRYLNYAAPVRERAALLSAFAAWGVTLGQ